MKTRATMVELKAIVGFVASTSVFGCAAPSINGGTLVPRGAEPPGEILGQWTMSACHDAAGGTLPDREGVVRVVKKIDGKVTLIELRDDTDSVLVDNVSSQPADDHWVFTLALARASGAQYFREYTVPKQGNGGRFIIAKEWVGQDTGDGFKGKYKVPSVVCALVALVPRASRG